MSAPFAREVLLPAALAVLLGCSGGQRVNATKPPPPARAAVDEDRAACDRLCARERACGDAGASCASTCAGDAARMKSGFVRSYVECFLKELDAKCASFDGPAREKTNALCVDRALARFPPDANNQTEMAEAVCDRMRRCMGFGAIERDACMQATLDPHEDEVKLGQRIVNALRRERVADFRACVDAAACPNPGDHDDAVHRCYETRVAGGAG